MSNQEPDRISVEETLELEVAPLHAVMQVVIEGDSLGFTHEALKKSKEVAVFLDELKQINYSSDNITLENVSLSTTSGKFLKGSLAKFTLKLDKIKLEFIPAILGAVSAQKNIEMKSLDYDFGELRVEKQQLLVQASTLAKQQAQSIGSALGVILKGVFTLSSTWHVPGKSMDYDTPRGGARLSKMAGTPRLALDGLEFVTNHKGKLALMLKVTFRVSEFSEGGG